MITKKDIIAIAKIVKNNTVNPVNPAYQDHVFLTSLVEDLSYYFKRCNVNFDEMKFIKACGA